jgi:sugar phosphate isomerase/epimerase
MQLGVSSYAFGWRVGVAGQPPPTPYDEGELLVVARRHALGIVQYGDHVPLHLFENNRLDRLRAQAASGPHPIEIEIGGRGLTRASLARYLDIAQRLNARLLRFVIDSPPYEPPVDEIVSILRDAIPRLESANVVLGVENHDRLSSHTLNSIMGKVSSSFVGICLDTANSLGAGEGLEQIVQELGRHTVNLHIKDFVITRVPHAMGFVIEGRPAGSGLLDIAALRDEIARYGRCRTAVLETWTPPEASLVETIEKEGRWVEQSLVHLKPLFASP